MKRLSILLTGALAFLSTGLSAEKLVKQVNPLVGTAGFGNVYPGAHEELDGGELLFVMK